MHYATQRSEVAACDYTVYWMNQGVEYSQRFNRLDQANGCKALLETDPDVYRIELIKHPEIDYSAASFYNSVQDLLKNLVMCKGSFI